jgi:transposase
MQNTEFEQRRSSAAKFSESTTVREAAQVFDLTPDTIKYWRKKNRDNTFHSGTRGGIRNTKFSPETQNEFESALLEEINLANNSITVCNSSFFSHWHSSMSLQFVCRKEALL